MIIQKGTKTIKAKTNDNKTKNLRNKLVCQERNQVYTLPSCINSSIENTFFEKKQKGYNGRLNEDNNSHFFKKFDSVLECLMVCVFWNFKSGSNK